MLRESYVQVVAELDAFKASGRLPNFTQLAENLRDLDISSATLASIYRQTIQYYVTKNHHLLKRDMPKLCSRYLAGMDVLTISVDTGFSACIVMRRLLEECPIRIQKQAISEMLKEPSAIWEVAEIQEEHRGLANRLEVDVARCNAADLVYSPDAAAHRHDAGLEYEDKLYKYLHEAGISFWTEDSLRSQGSVKTPDAKLQVPIAVNGIVIHWIDSKATFGDEISYRQHLEEQFQKYINRFGSGMTTHGLKNRWSWLCNEPHCLPVSEHSGVTGPSAAWLQCHQGVKRLNLKD
ncbi:hypothetical protein WJX84_006008 [Apatococcus fuscideae]|uniref:CDAN1-interacting nuclease 1 n=1 Tax=Apatococcus fuscideae TaxID=2026836 RepID=A0AAW1T7L0_9CHLO